MIHGSVEGPISPENIRIGDFGLSLMFTTPFSRTTKTRCGTRAYMSPEQLAGRSYGKVLLESWSLQICMPHPSSPTSCLPRVNIHFGIYIRNRSISHPNWSRIGISLIWGQTSVSSPGFRRLSKDFIKRLGELNSALRARVGESLDHPFITRKSLINYLPFQISTGNIQKAFRILV